MRTGNPGVSDETASLANGDAQSFQDRMAVIISMTGGAAELARRSGLSRRVIDKYRYGESDPARERLIALAQAAGVSVGWLAAGEGEAPVAANVPTETTPTKSATVASPDVGPDFVLVPVYDLEMVLGNTPVLAPQNATDHVALRGGWLCKTLGLTPERLAFLTGLGDSMEPLIRRHDLVLLDTSVVAVADDSVYVIESNGHLKVKRLQRSVSGQVTIRSDNPVYPEEVLDPEEAHLLRVAGRVRLVCRRV